MENLPDNPEKQSLRRSRISGCLLGGTAGDALGAPVEFLGLDGIRRRYGRTGATRLEWSHGRKGTIPDDTQMSFDICDRFVWEPMVMKKKENSRCLMLKRYPCVRKFPPNINGT